MLIPQLLFWFEVRKTYRYFHGRLQLEVFTEILQLLAHNAGRN